MAIAFYSNRYKTRSKCVETRPKRSIRTLTYRKPQMRHIAAYLLLQIGGNTSPSAKDVKKVLAAVGIEADDERLDKLISELKGKDINDVG